MHIISFYTITYFTITFYHKVTIFDTYSSQISKKNIIDSMQKP